MTCIGNGTVVPLWSHNLPSKGPFRMASQLVGDGMKWYFFVFSR
jgi:hypothetical protein